MINEAIVLAGGMGTRLKEMVDDVPKPMANINGKPFLEYLVNYLGENGVTHIVLSVGYKAELVKNYFGTEFNSIKISYATEEIPLGTGGGILLAMRKTKTRHVFILNGDSLFNIKLQELVHFHQQKNAAFSVALKRMEDGSRYGSVIIDEKNKITAFKEKSHSSKNVLINGGTYILDRQLFLSNKFPDQFSFEKDFLEKYFNLYNFFGCEFQNYFIDIGLPSTYLQAQNDFLDGLFNK